MRRISLAVTVLWLIAASASLLHAFPSPFWVQILLAVTGFYFALAGFLTARHASRR
jgi:hypothetical protein